MSDYKRKFVSALNATVAFDTTHKDEHTKHAEIARAYKITIALGQQITNAIKTELEAHRQKLDKARTDEDREIFTRVLGDLEETQVVILRQTVLAAQRMKLLETTPADAGPTPESSDGPPEDEEENARRAHMRALIVDKNQIKTKFSDIHGADEVCETLCNNIMRRRQQPKVFSGPNAKMLSGVLLYGPPGTGKTLVAKALASESGCTFMNVKASDITNKWQGEAEKNIRSMFEVARENAPTILFIDEIDSLTPNRDGGSDNGQSIQRMIAELLVQWDGVATDCAGGENVISDVLVFGATNRPWAIDPAIMRAGRMELKVYMPVPNADVRVQMLKFYTDGEDMHNIDDDFWSQLSESYLDRFSGADIRGLVQSAVRICQDKTMNATHYRRLQTDPEEWGQCSADHPDARLATEEFRSQASLRRKPLQRIDFGDALKHVHASSSASDIERFEQWALSK